nr:hypothetical protein [Tanacetum cinerariifolium]
MAVILEKTEHNTDFHQIVDFLEASHIRYALTTSPTIYVSHIRQFWSTARIETTDQETKIIATVDGKPRTFSESSLRRHLKLNDEEGISSLPDAALFKNLSLMGYNILPNQRRLTKRVIRIAQSKALSPDVDEPASLLRNDRQGEAFPTVSSLDAGLKARVKSLEDKERRREEPIQEDASITGRIIDIGEELGVDKSIEKGSNDTEEMVNVLSSMEATNILSSGGAAASVFPANVFPTVDVPTISRSFPTVSAIFITTSMVTPYTRRSREKKLQEQIDAQVAREMEEEFARENQRLSEQVARDSEIVRIHAEEQLKLMIKGLDRSNEVIAKHLSEYEQAGANLYVEERIELISELVKYQDHRAKILKYQAQQSKPLSNKEQREFYMSILKIHVGWKTKHFRGMTLEHIKEKFIPVWKQWEDFVPISSKEESERVKRPRIKLDQGSSKRVKISDTSRSKPSQEQQFKCSEGVFEEEHNGMMQLVHLEKVYIEALQVKHPIID